MLSASLNKTFLSLSNYSDLWNTASYVTESRDFTLAFPIFSPTTPTAQGHSQILWIRKFESTNIIRVMLYRRKIKKKPTILPSQVYRWHCTKSSDCQVRVRGAPSNVYGVNLTKAVIGAYMWQWWLVQILWHLPYVFSSFCCLMNYYTVTFATCWYMGWVKILQLTFCVNLTVATVNFL